MRFATGCSGIGAPEVAWKPLGWTSAFCAEIEAFPSSVLASRHPETRNIGDIRNTKNEHGPIDVYCAGTPCQAFSVAGLRKGLDDPRGNLTLELLAILDRLRPRWLVWENVPGVLSIDGGRVFGAFLGGLGQLGYGFAYRVLDAQYFGVPQRRRRVFVVGHLGSWQRAAAVLFERHSMSGHPAPRREKGQGVAHDVAPCLGASGRDFERAGETRGQDPVVAVPDVARCLSTSNERIDWETETFVTHALRGECFDASEDGTGRGTPLVPTLYSIMPQNSGKDYKARLVEVSQPIMAGGPVGGNQGGDYILHPIAFSAKDHGADASQEVSPTLRAGGFDKIHANSGNWMAVAFQEAQTGCREYDTAGTLRSNGPGHDPVGTRVREGMAVRRLTPRECERLQGFPDDYTLIPYKGKPAADGPRYKALGNSMAVPVMSWIGKRIQQVEEQA